MMLLCQLRYHAYDANSIIPGRRLIAIITRHSDRILSCGTAHPVHYLNHLQGFTVSRSDEGLILAVSLDLQKSSHLSFQRHSSGVSHDRRRGGSIHPCPVRSGARSPTKLPMQRTVSYRTSFGLVCPDQCEAHLHDATGFLTHITGCVQLYPLLSGDSILLFLYSDSESGEA